MLRLGYGCWRGAALIQSRAAALQRGSKPTGTSRKAAAQHLGSLSKHPDKSGFCYLHRQRGDLLRERHGGIIGMVQDGPAGFVQGKDVSWTR